jgi:hypothetical protein
MDKNLEIKKIPTELKVESIRSGELYPRLVLEIGLTSPLNFIILESQAKIILEKEKGKGYIDDSIVQQFYHIGDRIGAVVKDSVVQRSTLGAGEDKE